jgi:hypothetical protein
MGNNNHNHNNKVNRSLNINVAAANADTSTPLPTFAKKLGELPPTGHRSPHILKKPAGLSVQIPERPNSGSHLIGGSTSVTEMQMDSPTNDTYENDTNVDRQAGRMRQSSMSRRISDISRSSDLSSNIGNNDMLSSQIATGVATAGSDVPDRLSISLSNGGTTSSHDDDGGINESDENTTNMDPLQRTLYEAFGKESQDDKQQDGMIAAAIKTEEASTSTLLSSSALTSTPMSGSSYGGTGQDGNLASALPSKFARDLPSPSAFYREIYQQNNDVPSPFPSFNTPTPKSGTGGSFHWPAPMTRGGSSGGNVAGGGGSSGTSGGNGSSTTNSNVVHHPSPLKQADSVTGESQDMMNYIGRAIVPPRSRTPLANSYTNNTTNTDHDTNGNDGDSDNSNSNNSKDKPLAICASSMITSVSSLSSSTAGINATTSATSNPNTSNSNSLLHAAVRTASELTPTTEMPTTKRLRAE